MRWAETRIRGTTEQQVAATFTEEQPAHGPCRLSRFAIRPTEPRGAPYDAARLRAAIEAPRPFSEVAACKTVPLHQQVVSLVLDLSCARLRRLFLGSASLMRGDN